MNFADKSMEFGNIIVSDDPDPKVNECYGLIYKMIWKSATCIGQEVGCGNLEDVTETWVRGDNQKFNVLELGCDLQHWTYRTQRDYLL